MGDSRSFGGETMRANSSLRKGPLGDALTDIYTDVDAAFTSLETDFAGAAQADMGALTDNSGGAAPDGTIGPIGTLGPGGGDESGAVNANFADLAAKINAIRDALRALGLMA